MAVATAEPRAQLRAWVSRSWPSPLPRVPLLPLGLAAAVVVVTSIPYLHAYLTQPHGRVFMGFFFLGDDANTYLAKMREGWQGSWLWTNHYTTEPSPGAYFFTFWLALGHIAALTHLSLMATFQAARIAGAVALLAAAWKFIEHFVADPRARRFAIMLCAFGLGWGYLIQALGHPLILGVRSDTLDWRMPELTAFYSTLSLPHFIWAAAFQAAGVVLTLRAVERGSLRWGLLAGLAWAGEASIHAQMPILLGGATVAALLFRPPSRRGLAAAVLAFAIPAPYIVYSYLGYLTSPEVARWSADWRNGADPEAISLALALGPPLLLSLFAIPGVIRRRSRADVLLIAWLVLVVVIMWAPTPAAHLRRRFLDGIYLPLVVYAARGMYEQIVPWLRRARARRLVPFAYVVMASIGSAILILAPLRLSDQPQYSLARPQFQAMTWLARQPAGVVLSSPSIGLLLPAYTPDTVYVGQYSETYHYFQKGPLAYRLLTGRQAVAPFVASNHVRYVFWTDEFGGLPPSGLGAPAYTGSGVRVYRMY
ncbi:MAG: hypothetical protein ACREPA_04675 [Candidatus Dormibacteraceae bacterium]